jgi:uncharacterized membrane protein YuzA (DUF378 family)
MKFIDMLAWILLIVGGLNWGLVGLANVNAVDAIFGAASCASMVIYLLVGLSAVYSICRWKCCCKKDTNCKK